MANRITVCAYNVLFGDAILVEVPERDRTRYMLIDVGNVLMDEGSDDRPLLDAVDDIIARTNGGKIDLYVMTHEHMDHVQGLAYASNQGRTLQVDTVWLTASAAPGYYETHTDAREKKLALQGAVAAFHRALGAAVPEDLRAMLAVNGGASGVLGLNSRSTKQCVDHIRSLNPGNVHYVHRGYVAPNANPFKEAKLRILAPEEDTSEYYGRARAQFAPGDGELEPPNGAARPRPLSGIDGGAFYDLIDSMDRGFGESLLSIDRAENNTSVVIELEWRGRRLLFTGDAEQRSWKTMARQADLKPVDLLKVGHHGSENATPPPEILDQVLPPARKRSAVAVLSTCENVYNGVPSGDVIAALASRTRQIHRTTAAEPGTPIEVSLPARR